MIKLFLRSCTLTAAGILLLAGSPASAQYLPIDLPVGPLRTADEGVPRPRADVVPRGGPALAAPLRVPSTELGFEEGIAPAPGRTVSWRGQPCLVLYVASVDGRPVFSGGSRLVIATRGGPLAVGMEPVDEATVMAAINP